MKKKLCECGCGEYTKIRNGIPNKFIFGHQPILQPYILMKKRKLCECGCGEYTEIWRGKPRRFISVINFVEKH